MMKLDNHGEHLQYNQTLTTALIVRAMIKNHERFVANNKKTC